MAAPEPAYAEGGALRVTSQAEATRFLADMSGVLGALQGSLDEETALLRAGRVQQALEIEGRKSELAGRYLRAVQACRSNAVALARFASAEIAALKAKHAEFQHAVERNQAVLATARAVSESIVRGLAAEMAKVERPQTYGMGRQVAGAAGRPSPLVCSRSI